MKPIVECVPNISEGRDRALIDACAAAAAAVDGVTLLDIDPGADTNRTVITFAGDPEAVLEGAFRLVAESARRIDMRRHHGAHPRAGATDVCPFVPVAGVTMEDCAELARRLGERIGRELDVPVFLYEHAATRPERRNLADLRKGEYEALPQKMQDPAWVPDFGPHAFKPTFGAIHVGARKFLGAYNINLNTRSKKLANDLAFAIREKGRAKRDARGEIVRDETGAAVNEPGLFQHCKAAGWFLEQIQQCQVTMNLTDLDVTAPHQVFDKVCDLAAEKGIRVTGSELVGLIPLEPMLAAGRYFLKKQGRSAAVQDAELVRVAVESMGLDDVAPFEPHKKIVEWAIAEKRARLVDLTVTGFADELASESPAPGGGSVAALCGALGAALGAMVGNLTHGKKGYEGVFDELEAASVRGQALKAQLLRAIDDDTDAFNAVMEANRLPKVSPEQIAARDAAVEAANERAARVPLSVAQASLSIFELVALMIEKGNRNSVTDAAVGAYCAHTAVHGAALNVRVNLPSLKNLAVREALAADALALAAQADERLAAFRPLIDEALKRLSC